MPGAPCRTTDRCRVRKTPGRSSAHRAGASPTRSRRVPVCGRRNPHVGPRAPAGRHRPRGGVTAGWPTPAWRSTSRPRRRSRLALQPRGSSTSRRACGVRALGAAGGVPGRPGTGGRCSRAIYLHGGLLHILFNVLWIRQLGPAVEELVRPVAARRASSPSSRCAGFVVSTAVGVPFTVGARGRSSGCWARWSPTGEARRRLRRDGAAPVRAVGTDPLRPRVLHAGREQLRARRRLRRRASPPASCCPSPSGAPRRPSRSRCSAAAAIARHRASAFGLALFGPRSRLTAPRVRSEPTLAGDTEISEGARSHWDPGPSWNYPGGDLLSHAVTSAVPSALEGLTSVFGMGTGVAPPVWPPGTAAMPSYEILECRHADLAIRTKPIRGQAARPISTGQLNALRRLHLRPINLVIFQGPSEGLRPGRSHLEAGFALRCLQRLSLPHIATQRCPWRDNWHTSGASTPVLSY